MSDTRPPIIIPGNLKGSVPENIVTDALYILDSSRAKNQKVINDEFEQRIDDIQELAEISIEGGTIQIASAADFAEPISPESRAKVPTVGAIADGYVLPETGSFTTPIFINSLHKPQVIIGLDVPGDIHSNSNIYADGGVAAGGIASLAMSSGGGTGTISEIQIDEVPQPSVDGVVNLPAYPIWDTLAGKPVFASVATSGSYNDLIDKPSIPQGTVTSIGMTVPLGLSVNPAAITDSGIFAISFTDGYSIPTIDAQNAWDAKYDKDPAGIPITDLSDDVRTSLGKADTALESVTNLKTGLTSKGAHNLPIYLNANSQAVVIDALSVPGDIQSTNGGVSAEGIASLALNGGGCQGTITEIQIDGKIQPETDGVVNLPAYPTWNTLNGKPSLATVATSGSYEDLTNKPSIPQGTVTSIGMTVPTGLSVSPAAITTNGTFAIAFDNDYSIPTTEAQTAWTAKYDKPSTGIPLADLTLAVQTSLGKADSAIQGIKVNGGSVITPDTNKIVNITDVASASVLAALKTGLASKGAHNLPIYLNADSQAVAIDSLSVPGNIQSTNGGVSANGIASLAISGGGSQGTVTAINFEGSSEIYTPSDGLITLPSYPTAEDLILDGLASQDYVASYFASNFTQSNIKNTLGISDWALASTKPSYNFSEIGSKPTTLAGYNITDAHITNGVVTLGQNTITPATLNNGKIPLSQIPDAILGQMLYGGTVNGSGVVTLSQNAKDKWGITSLTLTSTNYADYEGGFFIASANGSSGVPSSLGVLVGDWIIATSAGWGKIDNTDAVTGVKGNAESNYRIGNVNITPANIGLGNVENTALSTWAGTNNITTVGTITTGVWHGSAIGYDYLASAVQTSLGKADSAIQGIKVNSGSVITPDANKIVNITDVASANALATLKTGLTSKGSHNLPVYLNSSAQAVVIDALSVPGNIQSTGGGVSAEGIASLALNGGGGQGTITQIQIDSVAQPESDGVVNLPAYPTWATLSGKPALATVATTGSYNDLIDKPSIPQGTVTSIGMTVPTGLSVSPSAITTNGTFAITLNSDYSIPTIANQTAWSNKYDKPSGGIPKTDLASAVQTSLGKADTALQSESDPVFTASAAYGITSDDITAWNAKQNALAFDGSYDASTNKVATKSTVTNAINALDVSNIIGFGAGKTLASLTETDGKIAATFQNISITKSQVSDFPTTWALSNITGADDLKAIEALTGTSGFLKKTAANTWSLDTDVASGTALSGVSTRVGTLEGYFTSGVANNAAQLGGQLPSYYAVAADYTKTTDFQSFSIKAGSTTLGTYSPTSALILSLVAGSNISFTPDATNHKLTINNTYSYTLPMASADSRGGIRVGNTLNIDSNGILNANIYDGLDQGYTTYALSAKQGKVLNTALDTLKTGLTSKGAHNLPIYLNSSAEAVAIDSLSVSGDIQSTAGGVAASGIASLAMNGGGGQGTLTQIQVNGVALADTSGVVNITATTGNAAGKIAIAGQQIPVYGLGSLAYLSSLAFTDLSSHPTTLGGYGITDAKIANGVITLGGNTITPLTGITSSMVTTALGYTPFNNANFTKANIKSTLGISDWALAASKPSYAFSEITGTVTNAQLAGSIANSKLASAGKFTIGSTAIELGTTYTAANFRSYLGLGGAATYGATSSVTDGGTSLVTSGGVYSYVNALLTAAMKIEGETTTAISDGSTTNPVTIGGQSVNAYKGMVVFYGSKEFVWVGTAWKELGDESSFALKTTTVSGTGYLTGGGALSSNQTIDIASSVKTKIDNGATAYGWGNHANAGYALASNLGTASTHAHGDYVTGMSWDSTNNKLAWSKGGTAQTAITIGYASSAAYSSKVVGSYTGNGGRQGPSYFGKNRVGFLMMNTTVNSNGHHKDWLIMDCYSGGDVGGAVAIGVNRQALGAYIMRSAAARSTWDESAELIGTHNYTTYTVKKDGTGASGTWSINVTGSAGSVAWANVTNHPTKLSQFTDDLGTSPTHTHSQYALAANLGTASTHAHEDYVTAIGTSGNTLTWSKGGTAQTAITVPYATAAGKLNTNAGSATNPVYFSGGVPVACTYSLNKTVPANAVFTDTTYSANNGVGLSGTTFYNSGVRAATINGNYLRINTNGTNADLTIPYATTAGSAPASDVYAWAKASTKPSYSFSEISSRQQAYIDWGGPNIVGSVSPLEVASIDDLGHNKFAFASAATVTVQYSRDGGSTWTAYGSDAERRSLVTLTNGFNIGGRTGSSNTTNDKLRVILNANRAGGNIYTSLRRLIMLVSTNGSGGCTVKVEHKTIANYNNNVDTWNLVGDYGLSGWSGWNSIPCGIIFGGSSNQTPQSAQIRLTFGVTSVSSTYGNLTLYAIRGIGFPLWQSPSTMASTGHLYSYDISQNAAFPAGVSAPSFYENGTALSSKYLGINANAVSATKATQDGDGNTISSTYLKLSGGTMAGTVKWNSISLPQKNSSPYAVVIDAFASGGEMGWRQLGSNAFDSTAYLPLAGGTMSNTTVVTNLNADLLDGQHGSYYQPKVSALGSTTEPVYISAAGTFSKASKYAGGTAVTLNGTSAATITASFYAPTGAGTSGQILKSSGSGAPTWVNQSTLIAGKATILETTRTIWGRDFNGSANVTGDMSNVGNIAFSASGKNIGGTMYFDTTNHRIGINDSTPSCAFDVTGDVQASGGIAAGGILNLAYNGAGTQGTLTQIQINGRALTDTSGIVNIPLANTTSTGDGAMSHSDKLKLDGIATGATNVNTDTVAGWGYTKNVGTVTGVKMNGSVKGSSGVVDLGTVITDVSGKADKQMNVLVDNNGSATITMTNSTTARYHFVRYPSSSSVTAITLQQATSALTAANCGTAHYELFKNEKSTAITLTLTKYSNSSYYLIAPSKTITIPANSSVELSYIHIAGASSTFYTVVTIGDVMINVS